jgi:hypothetical protein
MKFLLVILFLLISFLGFGQSVSAPDSKPFLQSTNGQDGSGFVLNGFNSTATVLASISLVNPPTGTTFNLASTTGLSPASGFTLPGNKTRLVVTGTMANINNALASLKINTGSVKGNIQISVAATVNPAGFFYNGTNGHFYRPISQGTTYTNARAAALNTTFKGQQGYLVTITSADEDAFIFSNVPQGNIWFALTDEVTEGRWTIDAGPEAGTLIKTSNGQTAGNIQGQYNNWAGGEPNNSGNEDYAVTKWSGGSQWNDLPNGFNCAYVIEYGTWTNPDDATFTEFYTNSVTHTNGDVLRAQFNFDFGSNIDETKFNVLLLTETNNQYNPTTNVSRTLNGLGRVDMTNDLDTVKINDGFQASITPGQVEWSIINPYEANLNGHRLQIDEREFFGTGINLNQIKYIKLFDVYEGPIQPLDFNGWWKQWVIPGNIDLVNKVAASSFQSSLRLQNGWYGIRAEYTFSPIRVSKPHGIRLTTTNNITSLYSSIVTVSDVFLAFKEVSNGGIFGNESGLEFTNGIQFMNADVDGNGMFNEIDTYKLLQHLTGVETINNGSSNLSDYIKLYTKSEYDGITKTNWNTRNNTTRNLLPFTLSNTILNNIYNINVTWKGDVNLSHSSQPTQSSSKTNSVLSEINASLMGEIIENKVVITLTLDPLQQEVVGTQFQVNYDNTRLKFEKVEFITKGNPTNFTTNRGSSVTVGSLITDGSSTLDKTTEYKIIFNPVNTITDILGLTSISTTDAVNKEGKQLKIKIN